MRTVSQQSPVSLTIPVSFAPQVFFLVGVLAGSTSGRPARQLTNNNISAPSWGNVPAGGRPSTGRNATTKGQ